MSGIINKSMRKNYNEHGVDEYYKLVSKSYRNPHFPAVRTCLRTWLNLWWKHRTGKSDELPSLFRVLDLAAGSGEVTVAVEEWWDGNKLSPSLPSPSPSAPPISSTIIPALSSVSQSARTPFIPQRVAVTKPRNRALEEISMPIPSDAILNIAATDPYTSDAYLERTGHPCWSLSFQDIAQGARIGPPHAQSEAQMELKTDLTSEELDSGDAREAYDMIICSFALHLAGSSSELWALLTELSRRATWLIILEPHKKPEIKDGWGWILWDCDTWAPADRSGIREAEILRERVHCRVFHSSEM